METRLNKCKGWWYSSALFGTLFTFTLIQSIGCGYIDGQWDLAAVHGRKITFLSLENNRKDVLEIPEPIALTTSGLAEIAGDIKQTVTNSTTGNIVLAAKGSSSFSWSDYSLKTLALDPSRALVFFTAVASKNLTIAVFNATSKKSFILYQTLSSVKDDLVFYNGSLFWTDDVSNSIMRLSTDDKMTTWNYEVFHLIKNKGSRGLTFSAETKTFFWIEQSGRIGFLNSLTLEEGEANTKSDNILALTTDGSYLYWAQQDFAAHFSIQRIPLPTVYNEHMLETAELFYKGSYKTIVSLSALCSGSIAFTDRAKAPPVVARLIEGGKTENLLQPKEKGLYGLVSEPYVSHDWSSCKKIQNPVSPLANDNKSTLTPVPLSATNNNKTTITSTSSSDRSLNSSEIKISSTPSPAKSSLPASNSSASSTTSAAVAPSLLTASPSVSPLVASAAPRSSTPKSTLVVSNIADEGGPSKVEVIGKPIVTGNANDKTVAGETTERDKYSTAKESSHYSGTVISNIPSSNDKTVPKINATSIGWCSKSQLNPCLNGGSCFTVDEDMFCLCLSGFTGRQCETQWKLLGNVPMPIVEVSEIVYIIICSSLSFLVVILVAAVIFLYVKVRRLDKKPKIRRRVIVSRSGQRERGSSVCELIDIENCCNMNECETPCYDRGATTSSSTGSNSIGEPSPTATLPNKLRPEEKSAKTRKEDKEKLIDF